MVETRKDRPGKPEPALASSTRIVTDYGQAVNILTGEMIPCPGPRAMGLSNAHIPAALLLRMAPAARLCILENHAGANQKNGGADRGEVTTFSRQSRKRLLQLFAGIDVDCIVQSAVFVTLTYHEHYPNSADGWHSDLENFMGRLTHRYPELAAIWRLEFQERGAPHYHLMAFNQPYIPKEVVTSAWGEIAHRGSPLMGAFATRTERPRNWRHACAEVSKYLAKQSHMALPGRTGRWWGAVNREHLPIHIEELELDERVWFRLKALVLATMPAKAVSPLQRHGGAGCWTMTPASDMLDMLAYAGQLDLPIEAYKPPSSTLDAT